MTFTAQMRLTITLFVVALVSVVGIVAYAKGASDERAIPLSERVLTECEVKDVSEESGTTEDVAAILRSAGYYGIPGDGGEILYSPMCQEKFPQPYRVAIADIAATDPTLADILAEGDDNGDEFITADESGWNSLP